MSSWRSSRYNRDILIRFIATVIVCHCAGVSLQSIPKECIRRTVREPIVHLP